HGCVVAVRIICCLPRSRTMIVQLFFFFQAEDGIRDRNVTGVQTCALPISECDRRGDQLHRAIAACERDHPDRGCAGSSRSASQRSEERRVGKERTSRWRRYSFRKKANEWLNEIVQAGSRQ